MLSMLQRRNVLGRRILLMPSGVRWLQKQVASSAPVIIKEVRNLLCSERKAVHLDRAYEGLVSVFTAVARVQPVATTRTPQRAQ
jgi:hypothetical protein